MKLHASTIQLQELTDTEYITYSTILFWLLICLSKLTF